MSKATREAASVPAATLTDSKDSFESLLNSLGIDNRLVTAIKKLGFEYPTLVQSQCLPLSIEKGRDVLVQARTGSGKTLAYAIPLIHKVLSSLSISSSSSGSDNNKNEFVKAIVLVPTRELCHQVHKIFTHLCMYCDDVINIGVLLSSDSSSSKEGVMSDDITKQEAMLRDAPPILISTPASLLRHIKQNTLDMRTSVEMVVIDEADLILSFGYKEDVDEIIKNLPKIYQGFLMSATLTSSGRRDDVEELSRLVLHNPLTLKLEEEKRSENLMQYYLEVPKLDKYMVLYVFIKLGVLKGKGLFFVNDVDAAYRLKLFWEQFHISSAVLNSDLPLQSRLSIIEQFNAGVFDYLIATDESTADAPASQQKKKSSSKKKSKDSEFGVSRGLDFHHVAFVVNVDFPSTVQSYIHRIGRTARANQRGTALTLLEKDNIEQLELLSLIQATQPALPLPKGDDALAPEVAAASNHASNNALPQPSPLNFDLKDIEGFRYRVEDVRRAVTKSLLRETKLGELKAEILNSDRLQSYFMDHKDDLKYLQHNRKVTHASKLQNHLKHVPEYILPRGMEAVEIKKRKRKHVKKSNTTTARHKKKKEDPLQSYDSVTLDDILDAEEDGDNDKQQHETNEVFDDDGHTMQQLPTEKPPALRGDLKKEKKGQRSSRSTHRRGKEKPKRY